MIERILFCFELGEKKKKKKKEKEEKEEKEETSFAVKVHQGETKFIN